MVNIAIHQPEHHPWLGFFNKKCLKRIFFYFLMMYNTIVVDFKIEIIFKTNTGKTLLSVPVLSKFDSKINEIKIDKTKN